VFQTTEPESENSRPLLCNPCSHLQFFAHENNRVKKGRAMQDLWGQKIPNRRRQKNIISFTSATPYAITDNDCEILGHTLRVWDLAGCTICIDCNVHIYCPRCVTKHPNDETAIAILCERHEAPQESQVSA